MTPLVQRISRLILLPAFIVAIAVWIKGYTSVGGGFSAGVILAAAVILQYMVQGYEKTEKTFPASAAPYAAVTGLVMVVLLVFIPVFFGYPLLSHFPQPGSSVIHLGGLELYTAVLFDLGELLIVFGFTVEFARHFARLAEGKEE